MWATSRLRALDVRLITLASCLQPARMMCTGADLVRERRLLRGVLVEAISQQDRKRVALEEQLAKCAVDDSSKAARRARLVPELVEGANALHRILPASSGSSPAVRIALVANAFVRTKMSTLRPGAAGALVAVLVLAQSSAAVAGEERVSGHKLSVAVCVGRRMQF